MGKDQMDGRLAAVARFLDAMAAQDIEAYEAELAEDFTQEIPFVPDGFAESVGPRSEAVAFEKKFWEEVIGNRPGVKSLSARIYDRTFHRTQDPDTLIVEYRSEFVVDNGARRYANRYISLFKLRDDKITLWREYANPLPVLAIIDGASG